MLRNSMVYQKFCGVHPSAIAGVDDHRLDYIYHIWTEYRLDFDDVHYYLLCLEVNLYHVILLKNWIAFVKTSTWYYVLVS